MFIRDTKIIKAVVDYLHSWMWSTFNLLSSAGAVIQEIQCSDEADYSPTSHEMIQEGKLPKFR